MNCTDGLAYHIMPYIMPYMTRHTGGHESTTFQASYNIKDNNGQVEQQRHVKVGRIYKIELQDNQTINGSVSLLRLLNPLLVATNNRTKLTRKFIWDLKQFQTMHKHFL